MIKIILLCLVERPTNVHRPNLSLPCVVILLCIVFAIICRHPPGLYCEGDCISLVEEMIRQLGNWRRIVSFNVYRVLDWSTARLCSARQMMSDCIVTRLSNTCLNPSYW